MSSVKKHAKQKLNTSEVASKEGNNQSIDSHLQVFVNLLKSQQMSKHEETLIGLVWVQQVLGILVQAQTHNK